MKRLFCYVPLVLILFSLLACAADHHTNPPAQTGKMPIRMNLYPALQQGFNVTRVNVRITKGDFTDDMDMLIDSTMASGTFEDLEIGTYAIDVSVFEDSLLIATGQGTGTVSPGQTTTVYITLQFVPGGLEVVVHWGLPYAECRRVLLVGNSHTFYNSGVNTHLQALLNAAHPEWGAVVQAQTVGGYYLQNHLDDPNTIAAIQDGNWDLVILQEQSSRPMNDPGLFYSAAVGLDSLIASSGALTGFYMTWAWRNNPEMYVPIRDAYNYIGAYLDALVIPCGIAYHTSAELNPDLNLYAPDNYHPSLCGTYLVACTFLASIWNVNPVGNAYVPAGIDAPTAAYLQNLAWTTVQAYHNGKNVSRPDSPPSFPASWTQTPELALLKAI